jgi:hypothetical protein
MAVTGLTTMREELQSTSVDALFVRGEADRLLERPKATEELEKIVKSERGDHRLRVLAHELLLKTGKKPDARIVRIYCEAISGAFMHNWWGLPGHAIGKFGETVLAYKEAALPYLVKEMDDPALLTYMGPDAAKNRENRYCVGDLATFLVSKIMDRDYPDASTPEEREGPRIALMKELAEMIANEKRK